MNKIIAEKLEKDGLSIFPNFLPPEDWLKIREDLDILHQMGGFRHAGVGQGSRHDILDVVRRDHIYWLDQDHTNEVQSLLYSKLNSLKLELNRSLYLGINNFEGHYAVYPEGGFYKRHLDCFQQNNDRIVSLILYLNKNWQPSDGGKLRIYGPKNKIEIEPAGGTLVCFMSRESEHEVLLSHSPRFSFCGWFKIK